jgi:hypothetical protein
MALSPVIAYGPRMPQARVRRTQMNPEVPSMCVLVTPGGDGGSVDFAKTTNIPIRAAHGGARGPETPDGARGPEGRDSAALRACRDMVQQNGEGGGGQTRGGVGGGERCARVHACAHAAHCPPPSSNPVPLTPCNFNGRRPPNPLPPPKGFTWNKKHYLHPEEAV